MIRGTSGRTRTTPLRNATRASNAYIIYRGEEKGGGGVEKNRNNPVNQRRPLDLVHPVLITRHLAQ